MLGITLISSTASRSGMESGLAVQVEKAEAPGPYGTLSKTSVILVLVGVFFAVLIAGNGWHHG
jgi:hypothetical protein